MNTSRNFMKMAAICCFLSGITTVILHKGFSFGGSFEESLQLYKNSTYHLSKWVIIFHCLFVLIGMSGLYQMKRDNALARLGFLGFIIFSVTEISRQFIVLIYLNGLREKYLLTNDEAVQQLIRLDMENIGLIGVAMFLVFAFFFGLGNLCYGITVFGKKLIDKLLGSVLIFWSVISFLSVANEFIQNQGIGDFIQIFNFTFQSVVRLFFAYWLWRMITNQQEDKAVLA